MSDEQQQAAIGRTVEEYLTSKKKLAALQSEAGKIVGLLSQIANNMAMASSLSAPGGTPFIATVGQQVASLPSGDRILSVANDIKAEVDNKHGLYISLKNMGIEPKD